MFTFINFLKVSLPFATVTSATIVTTLLVATEKKDTNEKNKNSNLALSSFEKEISDFKERKIFYSENGDANGPVEISEEEQKRLEELRQKGVGVSKNGKNLNEIQEPTEHSLEQKPDSESPKGIDPQVSQPLMQEEEESDTKVMIPSSASDSDGGDGSKKVPEEKTTESNQGKENHNQELADDSGSHPEKPEAGRVDTPESEDLRTEEEDIHEDQVASLDDEEQVRGADSEEQSIIQQQEGENDGREENSESSSGRDGEDSKESRVDLEKLNELQSKLSNSEEALGAILAKFI